MANRRELKKRIRTICGDLASDALIASVLFKNDVDREKINEIINDIAVLQEETLARVTFSYDKTARDFETASEYHRERRKYFATAYGRLNKSFIESATAIVARLNEVVPAEARKVVSTL